MKVVISTSPHWFPKFKYSSRVEKKDSHQISFFFFFFFSIWLMNQQNLVQHVNEEKNVTFFFFFFSFLLRWIFVFFKEILALIIFPFFFLISLQFRKATFCFEFPWAFIWFSNRVKVWGKHLLGFDMFWYVIFPQIMFLLINHFG